LGGGLGGDQVVPSTQAQDCTGLPLFSLQFTSKSAWLVYSAPSLHVQLSMLSVFWQGLPPFPGCPWGAQFTATMPSKSKLSKILMVKNPYNLEAYKNRNSIIKIL
jgi:hypothetical protein